MSTAQFFVTKYLQLPIVIGVTRWAAVIAIRMTGAIVIQASFICLSRVNVL